MNSITVQPVPKGKGRKKGRNIENWKRTKAKKARCSSPGFPPPPACDHRSSEAYQCAKVQLQDIRRFHQKFYSTPERVAQNNFILHYITVETPKRKRPRVENLDDSTHKKVITTKYFMPTLEHSPDGSQISCNVPVCKNLFIKTLCISRDRVQLLAKKYMESGFAPPEARGGNRKAELFHDKRKNVKTFIEAVPVLESHYCRGRQVNRQYLSSELNIKVLWEKYEQTCEPQNSVKYECFRSVFVTDYNIGFGSPATDCCSTCLSIKEDIKITRDPEKKSNMLVDLAVHKRKAKAFFDELRSSREGELTLSYDCQKNQNF